VVALKLINLIQINKKKNDLSALCCGFCVVKTGLAFVAFAELSRRCAASIAVATKPAVVQISGVEQRHPLQGRMSGIARRH
jgi:hypothetical protein